MKLTSALPGALCVRIRETVEPKPEWAAAYEALYPRYDALYPALEPFGAPAR